MSHPGHAHMLVVQTMPSDDPVVNATLGMRLRLVGLGPMDVVAVTGVGRARAEWASDQVNVRTKRGVFWPVRAMPSVVTMLRMYRPKVVAVQDEWSALLLSLWPRRWRRWTLVMDKWGLPAEELELSRGPGLKSRTLRGVEWWNLRRIDVLITVSERLATIVRERGASRIVVVPNGLPSDEVVRHTGAPTTETLLAYVGGGQRYQCSNETVELLAEVSAYASHVRVALVSSDASLRSLATSRGIDTYSMSQTQARLFTSKCTAVVALRGDHLAVYVAAPVKIAEAALAGVPVVMTESASELVHEMVACGAALLVDYRSPDIPAIVRWLDIQQALPRKIREQRTENMRELFSMEGYREALAEAWDVV